MSNEVVLVDQFIKAAQDGRETPLPDDVAFELFAAATVLDGHNLSDEEVESGRIGGGQDGGIDAVYTFLDGSLINEDSELFEDGFKPSEVRKGADISLWLIQAKRSESFGEDPFNRVSASAKKLLDLNFTDEQLAQNYASDVIARIRLFTRAWTLLSIRSPRISITFVYVSRGDVAKVSAGVAQKMEDLKGELATLVPGAIVDVRVVGAKDLWSMASATPEYDLQLRFKDYISEGDSYAGLVSLPEYFRFLSDSTGALRGHLFDWNVRDFQGAVTVNRQMQATLESDDERDFWWLNNGVTILCSAVNIGGEKTFTLSGVQIVNGMQTSHAIHDVLMATGDDLDRHKRRSVQVRVIRTLDEATRDDIIRATNSQTKVPDASLHATENLHRQIESHFASEGWYYDRRKNFYKNAGKPADKIISIPTLGQAVMAIGLSRPDDARARPSTLLNNESDYAAVFSSTLGLDVYLWIATVQRRVDSLLLSEGVGADASTRTNTRFFISTYLVTEALGAQVFHPSQLASLAKKPFDLGVDDVKKALSAVIYELATVSANNSWQTDRAAKSNVLTKAVVSRAIAAAGEGKPDGVL